jgi:hydrogenase nickel incorporation protein HypA/HybF
MHEYGIVHNLLSQVDDQVRGHDGKRAVRIVLAVDGGHVDERFLREAFDMFKVETTAHDAELLVTHVPAEVWCPSCGASEKSASGDSACPRCGGASVPMTLHDELYLQSVEIEV